MSTKLTLQIFFIICTHSLTISARVNVVSYKSEDINNCNISLDFSNTGLKRINSDFINNNCLRSLKLQNNSIEKFEEGIFDDKPYLEYLDLSRNYINLNNFFSFGTQSRLKVLILDHNIYHFHETITKNYSDDEDENKIRSIKNGNITHLNVPHDFPELQHLSLRNVSLNSLSHDWLNHFPKLNYLDISQNNLTIETLDFLLQNISLTVKSLVLENVGLNMVRSAHLDNIEKLILNHNPLPRLSSAKCHEDTLCFDLMDNLKILSISNCSVQFIEEKCFRYLKNLLELDLSNNKFRIILNKTFDHVPSLTKLNLSQNLLNSMPNISSLKNLIALMLDEMKVEKMLQSLQQFPHLPKLKFISMRNNKLKSIPTTLFSNLPALEKIDLSNNHITSLPSWDSQKSLRQLDLNSNKIENLEDLSINEAKILECLILKNNPISKIKLTSLKNLLNSDVILNL